MLGRRGSSEVIAAVLMIAIAVAGAMILYVYSSGMMGSLQGSQPPQPYGEKIVMEYYDWTGATLKLTLRNVGVANAKMIDFFVHGNKVSVTFGTGCPSGSLPVQTSCVVTLAGYGTVTTGIAYVVKIVTRNSVIFSYSCIAGQVS